MCVRDAFECQIVSTGRTSHCYNVLDHRPKRSVIFRNRNAKLNTCRWKFKGPSIVRRLAFKPVWKAEQHLRRSQILGRSCGGTLSRSGTSKEPFLTLSASVSFIMSNSALTPAQTAHALVELGIAKHNTRYEIVFLKAVSAGVMLSFGGLLAEVFGGGATGLAQSNPGIAKVLTGFVFPVGLVMLVLQGHELLTSNMMLFPMAAIKRAIPWWSIPVNWFIVLFGNLVGSLFTAAVLVHFTGIISTEPYIHYVQAFAIKKAGDPTWHQIFLRGIGCNWLVCVAIWQGTSSKDTISKIVALWIPIWVFVACGFDHIVANMFFIPLGIMFGAELTVAEYIKKSFFASFFGNIIGALLIGLPATYFYLRDYQAGGLRAAEEASAPPPKTIETHHDKPSTISLEAASTN